MVVAEEKSIIRLLLAVYARELKTAFFLTLSGEPNVKIVATAVNSAELLTYSRTFQPEVIVLEWELPGQPMADVLPKLCQAEPAPKIFIISKPSSYQQLREISATGDLFMIDSVPEDFINTLEAVIAAGETPSNGKGEK
jgi:chemotaxis response regulator CheB